MVLYPSRTKTSYVSGRDFYSHRKVFVNEEVDQKRIFIDDKKTVFEDDRIRAFVDHMVVDIVDWPEEVFFR